ncbi:MAG: hypothetical protein EP343_09625 [Deltaproteobacteria bacterium]|nr:MAG: hypothetical protein EP343_09625 [Deltaproteobacteria bacterium]
MHSNVQFQAGGTVRDNAFYVERAADQELTRSLLAREYCYVLAPRQIGKSSLRARTERRLREQGVRCVSIDLTSLGSSEVTQEEWYYGLVEEVGYRLDLDDDPADFWMDNERLSPVHRWSRFLSQEVLSKTSEPIVIFIDEIDAVLSLPFSRDDFFASIRAFFNARADDLLYERLTFCLLGVAAPSDLIADPTRTPFNIGHDVYIEDFTAEEAKAFLPGLAASHIPPEELLRVVYDWTNGHPYMTQRVFETLMQSNWFASQSAESVVEEVVTELFLGHGGQEDTNLSVAEKLFQRNELKDQMLQIYRQLLEDIPIEANLYNPIHMALRLTGMVSSRKAHGSKLLWVRNRIFSHVFDRAWVQKQETERLLNSSLERWLLSGREEDYVLRGKALEEAQLWAEGRDDISADERAFLIAGLEVARKEEEARQKAERDRERRQQAEERARFQQRAIRVLALLVFALVGLVAVAFWQYRQATKAKELERAAKNEAVLAQRGERRQKAQVKKALAQVKKAFRQVSLEQRKTQSALVRAKKAERTANREKRRALRLFRQVKVSLRKERRARRVALRARRKAERLRQQESRARKRAEQAEKAAQEGNKALSLAAQSGREMVALRSGILGVVPSLRSRQTPPLQALEGLIEAVNAARQTRGFRGHQGAVTKVRFVRGGKAFVSASVDKTVRLWDIPTHRTLGVLQGHQAPVRGLAYSSRKGLVATSDEKGVIKLWNLSSCGSGASLSRGSLCRPKPQRTLLGHREPVRSLVFSPSGQWLASTSDDGSTRIWNIARGQTYRVLRGHRGRVLAAAFSSNGALLATAGTDATILLWRWRTGKQLRVLRGHRASINALQFLARGQKLVSASDDQTARLWKVRQGVVEQTWNHSGRVTGVAVSSGQSYVATASSDHLVRVWSVRTGKKLRVLDAHEGVLHDVAFSRRGTILTASQDRSARLWRLFRDHSAVVFRGHRGFVNAAVFSGSKVVTASSDSTLRVWTRRGRLLRRILGHRSWVTSLAVSNNGLLATSSKDRTVRLWKLATGKLLKRLPGLSWQESVAFSPDARYLVSAGDDRYVRLMDGRGRLLKNLKGHTGTVNAVALSRDGRWLASGSEDRTVRIWDVQRRKLLFSLEGHEGAITSVAFSPNGEFVLSGSKDQTAWLWRRSDGKRVSILRGHREGLFSVAFSSDGKRIATASADKTVRLWDAQTARQIATLLGHNKAVLSVQFSPDDAYVLTGSEDRTARTFPVSEHLYLKLGCLLLRYQKEFKGVQEQCKAYLPKAPGSSD